MLAAKRTSTCPQTEQTKESGFISFKILQNMRKMRFGCGSLYCCSYSLISLLFPLIPQMPQFVFTMTLGSKSATSHFSLPNAFSPGVTTQSNSPATPSQVASARTSRSTSVGLKPVTNTAHLVCRSSGSVPPHVSGSATWRSGSPAAVSAPDAEGKPRPGEKRKKTSVYGSSESASAGCTDA